jgi:hypothetical protein
MRKILLAIMLFVSLQVCGQAMLGYYPSEIKKELTEREYDYSDGYTDDGYYFIRTETERAHTYYYFVTNITRSDMVMIFPKSQVQVNYYVEYYNNHYVVKGKKNWTAYINDEIADIKLSYIDGIYAFVWVFDNE